MKISTSIELTHEDILDALVIAIKRRINQTIDKNKLEILRRSDKDGSFEGLNNLVAHYDDSLEVTV